MLKQNYASPCDGNCHIDPKTNYCAGCFRTMKEIITWMSLTVNEKKLILKKIKERKKLHSHKRK